MSENPYQPPATGDEPRMPSGRTREDLRQIASFQKGVICCLLARLILMVVLMASGVMQDNLPGITGAIRNLSWIIDVGIGLIALYFVFQLASKVYGSPVLGVVFGLLVCIPCVGLII